MNGYFLTFRDTRKIEHHGSCTVPDHDFAFLAECLDDFQHGDVIRFTGILLEYGNGITAGEHKRIVFIFMPFQIGHYIVHCQDNAGICLDFLAVRYREYFIRNAIFKKCFQILEQTASIYRIYC